MNSCINIKLGSNVVRNTNGVISIQGKEQVVLEWDPETCRICLTMDFYDEQSTRLAHLRRNRWAFNNESRLLFINSPESPPLFPSDSWLKILKRETGESILEVQGGAQDIISITYGRFYSHQGQLVEISTHYCRVAGGTTMFGDVVDVRGGAISLK